MGAERRRGARIKASFWVSIDGVETKPQLRRGNISVSGIFFETAASLGPLGTIVKLSIADFEQKTSIRLMARLVRELRYNDWWTGDSIMGSAFEFLFESDQQRKDGMAFVRVVVKQQATKARNLQMHYLFPAQVESTTSTPKEATIHTLSVDGMTMETSWPIEDGEMIQVEVNAPASKKTIRFSGKAIKSDREKRPDGTDRFTVQVLFSEKEPLDPVEKQKTTIENPHPDSISAIGHSIADALDTLLSESNLPANTEENAAIGVPHLTGKLSHINVSSLLTFLELERRTGIVELRRDTIKALLFLRSGHLIDIEGMNSALSLHESLSELLEWNDGEFIIIFQPVEREDRFKVQTNTLLIQLCLKKDEYKRNQNSSSESEKKSP